jgi:segregation and condensation protein B
MSSEEIIEETTGESAEDSTEARAITQVDPEKVAAAVEAILFSSAEPTPSNKLSDALGKVGVAAIKKAVGALNEQYEAGGHTFRIRQVGGGYQFFVLPSYTDYVKRLYTKERKLRLTKAALETMAIIAYKQPISKNQIEYIRGVACDGVVSNLLRPF